MQPEHGLNMLTHSLPHRSSGLTYTEVEFQCCTAVLAEQTRKKMQHLEENLKHMRHNFLKRRPPTASADEDKHEGICLTQNYTLFYSFLLIVQCATYLIIIY